MVGKVGGAIETGERRGTCEPAVEVKNAKKRISEELPSKTAEKTTEELGRRAML